MSYILTIDAGTGSGRALLFDFNGRQMAQASREWVARSIPKYPGSAVFDTQEAWRLICECIREVIGKSGIASSDIVAVTAASMREGFVLYDRNKREIWACPNIDARAGAEARKLIQSGLDKLIYKKGGDGLAITAPPRLHWIANHQPKIYKQARRISMISDWVLFKCCGEIVTDPSCGSSSGLFDLKKETWSIELIQILELPDIFPFVQAPGTVLGRITPQCAEETGLDPRTVAIVGGGDTQLGLIGCAGPDASPLTVVGGTFWQTALVTKTTLIDPKRRVRTLCHVLPGQWMTEGIGFLNGLAMRWVRDAICRDLLEAAARDKEDPYVLMERAAAMAPAGSSGVAALVSGVMNAKRWVQAPLAFIGMAPIRPECCGELGRACMIRATQESAVFTAKAHWNILRDLADVTPGSVTFCGGASKGTLWPKILADVFNLPVKIPKVKEATSLGATFCALVGLKEFQHLADASKNLVQWERVVEPDKKAHALYKELSVKQLKLQESLLGWVEDETLPAMWRAPGV